MYEKETVAWDVSFLISSVRLSHELAASVAMCMFPGETLPTAVLRRCESEDSPNK